jgi:hypothetical protein
MAKKKVYGGGSDLSFYDPEPEDCCEYHCQKKVGRSWSFDACGEKAVIVTSMLHREPNEFGGKLSGRTDLKVCKRHLTKMITEMISILEYL